MTKDEDILLVAGDKTAGEMLKEAREAKGLAIADIEQVLKIKARHVEAIEFDDHDELPGRVYAIGFIRAYAEYMGFDPDQMVELFKMRSVGRHTSIELSSHGEVVAVSQTPSRLIIIICVLLLCGFGIYLGKVNTAHNVLDVAPKAEVSIPQVPETLSEELSQKTPISYTDREYIIKNEDNVSASAGLTEGSETVNSSEGDETVSVDVTAVQEEGVVIKAIYDSWIQIRNSKGQSVYSGILQMGNVYEVPEGAGYRLMTGNAGGTEIIVDGVSQGVLGAVSQVRKNIMLDEL